MAGLPRPHIFHPEKNFNHYSSIKYCTHIIDIYTIMSSVLKSLCRLAKVSQNLRSRTGLQKFGSRPVFVPTRGLCEKKGLQNGKGDFLKDESRYVGDTRDGRRCGKGECWDEFGHYSGDWVSDIKEGYGVLTYANGIVYEGEFVEDEPNGHGKLTWLDGTVYEGVFKDGILSDDTRLVSISGVYMEGNCTNGSLNGYGKIMYVLDDVFPEECGENKVAQKIVAVSEGEFKESSLNGEGKFTYGDGTCYAGMFVNNRFHGLGRITEPDGLYTEAEYDEGVMRGWCKIVSADGFTMECKRVDGEFVGTVKATDASGVVSEGSYVDGKMHGLWRTYRLSIDHHELPVAQGHYHHGVRQGRWTFTLPGGETYEEVF